MCTIKDSLQDANKMYAQIRLALNFNTETYNLKFEIYLSLAFFNSALGAMLAILEINAH